MLANFLKQVVDRSEFIPVEIDHAFQKAKKKVAVAEVFQLPEFLSYYRLLLDPINVPLYAYMP